jgi:glycosyltransferase involved in cell wall biosynthesis
MRIAIKAAQIAPGGGLTHLNKIIEWFGKIAPEIEFLLICKKGQENLFISPPPNFIYKFYRTPGLSLPAQIWWERRILPGILERANADLLFEPGNRGTLSAPCPKVSLIHNIAPFDDEYLRHETPYQKLRQRILRRATLESMLASDGIIFLSEFSRRLISGLADFSGKKSTVVYHGRFESRIVDDGGKVLSTYGISKPYLLNVSHIWHYKKIFEMALAYSLAHERKPNLPNLVVAGNNYSPTYYNKIRKLVEDRKLAGCIRLLGTVPEDVLPVLYRGCQAFLFPSVIEACPNSLIDAFSNGCAIACSNRGVMPEIAAGAALYFDPDNIEDFASKIISIVEDAELRSFLRSNALERASFFSWEKTARQTLDFFYEVLGNRPEAPATKHSERELVEA